MMNTKNYRSNRPRAELRSFVDCLWELQPESFGDKPEQNVIPDGCSEIIFEVVPTKDGRHELAGAFFVGQLTRAVDVDFGQGLISTGARLSPAGAFVLVGGAALEISDEFVSLDEIFSSSQAILTQWTEHSDTEMRLRVLEEFLCGVMSKRKVRTEDIAFANYLHNRKYAQTPLTTASIASDLEISTRQVQRLFKKNVGLTPGQLRARWRIQKAIMVQKMLPSESLESISWLAGYHDTSHFVREFKSFSNLKPSAFFNGAHLASATFVDPAFRSCLYSDPFQSIR